MHGIWNPWHGCVKHSEGCANCYMFYLDRVFYAGACYGKLFAGKPSAAVATCWRAGASATLDRLNKYFTYSEMPVVSSSYWNIKHEGEDRFGERTLRMLAENMVKMLGVG